jgi:hypothetical protein
VDAFWGVLLAGLLTLVFVWSLRDASRAPERWRRPYSLPAWRRVLRWIAIPWVLALGLAWVLGAGTTVYAVIGIVGFSAAFVAGRFASAAWFNDVIRRWLER